MADGSEQPTLFASRALSKYERNYSQIKKEGLAIVFAVKKFHQFAFGGHFTNQTYHKLLLRLCLRKEGYHHWHQQEYNNGPSFYQHIVIQ